jgi:acetylornithine deacetylase
VTHAAVELLRELVRIPSPSGDERAAADCVAERLAAAGLETKRVANGVLARLARGPGDGPALLLNSHLDTVPVGEGWTRDPLAAELADGAIWGRGANDAKASVAAMVHAACALARAPGELRGTLWLALTSEEETSNAGMTAVIARLAGEQLDGAVTGEPTGLEVVRAQAGLAVLIAEWIGRGCHAAHVARVEHDSALARGIAELAATTPHIALPDPHPLLGTSTVTPTVFRAGEAHNVVPDRARATFDARLAAPHDARSVRALLAELMPTADVTIRSERLGPVETAEAHPLVRCALECSGKRTAIGSNTLSDMALLRGTPSVKCGPGETVRSHTPDEFVLAAEVEAGAAFYAALVPRALAALTRSGAR